MGPIVELWGTHRSWAADGGAAAAGEVIPPAAVFGGLWNPLEKSQKYTVYGILKIRW